MKIPSCSHCNRPAAWQRPWDKTRLCVTHFNRAFLKRVQKTINKYNLFERNDKIAVGVSGGKDSVVMMDVLSKLQRNYPSKIIAITIDEGIKNYREDGIKYARIAAETAGVEHRIFSFKEKYDYDLDEALIILGANRLAPCSYCGPFRRKLLNEAAREVQANKLVTGHNADDEAQTILMNLMRGDILKTLHSNPYPIFKNSAFVNRVKPFRKTTEQEIVLYATLNSIPYQEQSCPHADEAYRGKIRTILTEYMRDDPSVIFSIVKSADLIHELAQKITKNGVYSGAKPIRSCLNCSEPTNNEFCNACGLKFEIEAAANVNENL